MGKTTVLALSVPNALRIRLIAVLATTQILGWGTSFDMLGVLGRPMAQSLGMPNEIVFLGLTVMMVVSGFAGPPIGRAVGRHGAAAVLAAGSVTLAAGLTVLGFAGGPVAFFVAWSIIGLGGGLGLSAPAYAAVVERDVTDAKLTIGVLMVFTGLSTSLMWPVLAWVEARTGWRTTIFLAAGLQLALCLPLHLFGLPRRGSREAVAAAAGRVDPVSLTPGNGRLAFAYIAVATSVLTFVTFGLSPSLVELLRRSGASADLALQLASLRGLLGIAARLGDILLGKRSTPLVSAVVSCSVMLAGFLMLGVGSGVIGWMLGFVVLYGFGSGAATLARTLLPLSFFSALDYGRQSGRLALPQNLANAAAPVVYTALLDRSGPGAVVAASAGLLAVTLVCLILLAEVGRRPRARPGDA